jgi:RNA polymerase sigma-70 factor (ECF subfamily)
VLQIVKSPGDADDVMQDALLRAYRAMPKFRGDALFSTWLFRIATNSALACLASRKRTDARSTGWTPRENDELEPSLCDDPEQIMFGKQMAASVGAALDAMHPEFKTAVVLREFEGLSYHEIADAMVCPVGTVKSRISSARNAIAARLQHEGFLAAGACRP